MGRKHDDEEEIVECPRLYDVVFRKGPTYRNNPGNMYYRELIESSNDQHSKARGKERRQIILAVMQAIEEREGRFLEWSKPREMWIIITDREKIHSKVAASFKYYHRTIVAIQEQHDKQKEKPQVQEQQTPQHTTSQLADSIATATAVVEENIVHTNTSSDEQRSQVRVREQQHESQQQNGRGQNQDELLQHYYSGRLAYNSKRRKTEFACHCISDDDINSYDGDRSCFGKSFIPT